MVIGNVTCPFSVTCEVGEGGETLPNFHSVKGREGGMPRADQITTAAAASDLANITHAADVRSFAPSLEGEKRGRGREGGMLLASHAAAV